MKEPPENTSPEAVALRKVAFALARDGEPKDAADGLNSKLLRATEASPRRVRDDAVNERDLPEPDKIQIRDLKARVRHLEAQLAERDVAEAWRLESLVDGALKIFTDWLGEVYECSKSDAVYALWKSARNDSLGPRVLRGRIQALFR